MKQVLPNNPIVFFDGECGLCDKSLKFIIKYDYNKQFYFCPLQAPIARKLIPLKYLKEDTVILYLNGKIYIKSEAAFLILSKLKTRFRFLHIFSFLPRLVTDSVYVLIARFRKRIFRSPATCQLPSPELHQRTL